MHQTILDALRSGDHAAALAAAREAIAAQPQDAQAHRLLSAALHQTGDRPAALAAIDHALSLAPDDAQLHLERAGLLLGERQLDDAQAALARSIGLDPNQFPAYILQAQLALGRGDLDEAERLARSAARMAPEHPHVAALEGSLALRRGDADRGLAILGQASERHPDDPQLRHALAFAYLAKGHLAFAEQGFRRALERTPGSLPLRSLIADIVRRQGRPADAAAELAPLLDAPEATPALRRQVGVLELEAGNTEAALPHLLAAFQALPGEPRALMALVEAWRRSGDVEQARSTLDAALQAQPQQPQLWHARLLFEPFAGAEARAVVERWLQAMPDFVPALEARSTIHDVAGERDLAQAMAQRITELHPGHTKAELRVIDGLMQADPDAAVARVESLLARAQDPMVQRSLRQLLGRTLDAAGQPGAAAATWAELHVEVADQRLPLPTPTAGLRDFPPLAPLPEPAPAVLLLWGAPGSLVERVAVTLDLNRTPLVSDRFGPNPPQDPLQRYTTAAGLVDGSLDGAYLAGQWRAALPGRGINDGQAFDWLLWWDNALLLALRPYLPEAVLLVAVRDPRDMLLDWLAYGSPAPFALESPLAAARWLAATLTQVVELVENDLFPHRLLRLDDIAQDPEQLAQAIGDAMAMPLTPVPDEALGPARFARGHWRAFAEPLAEAFALLSPVAQRLGYSAD